MKSEYQIYLDRQAQIENTFDASAVLALTEFARSLPIHLRTKALTALAQSFHIDKVIATIDGYEYEGSLADKGVFWRAVHAGQWSKEIIDVFLAFFQKARGGNYIDFGANIGLTVVPICRGNAQRCFAVEAIPENFGMLRRNLLRNGIENCTVFDMAIFNKNTTVEFELSERNFGDHRVRASHTRAPDLTELYDESNRRTAAIPAVRCDDLFRDVDLSGPLAIKSDIQGAEGFLFTDGSEILRKCDLLVAEFWPYAFRRAGFTAEEMFHHFRSQFSYGAIIGDDMRHPGRNLSSVDQLIKQLREKFIHIDDQMTSAQEKTSHVNIILTKIQAPI
jgi:FkbM family methyltransferase